MTKFLKIPINSAQINLTTQIFKNDRSFSKFPHHKTFLRGPFVNIFLRHYGFAGDGTNQPAFICF